MTARLYDCRTVKESERIEHTDCCGRGLAVAENTVLMVCLVKAVSVVCCFLFPTHAYSRTIVSTYCQAVKQSHSQIVQTVEDYSCLLDI